MNSLPIACKDAATTFLLARRAERLARPMVEQVDGAWRLSITVTLGDMDSLNPWHISIYAHYADNAAEFKPNMPVYKTNIVTSAQLGHVIEQMHRLAAEQVLATAEALAVEADAEAAEIQTDLEAGGEDADA